MKSVYDYQCVSVEEKTDHGKYLVVRLEGVDGLFYEIKSNIIYFDFEVGKTYRISAEEVK